MSLWATKPEAPCSCGLPLVAARCDGRLSTGGEIGQHDVPLLVTIIV